MSIPAKLTDEMIYIKHAFLALRDHARATYEDQAAPGTGGSWSADERRGNAQLTFIMSDGGYNAIIHSQQYGVRMSFDHTYQFGDRYQLKGGSLEQVAALLKDLGLDITQHVEQEKKRPLGKPRP